jgi:uridine phosphorylase
MPRVSSITNREERLMSPAAPSGQLVYHLQTGPGDLAPFILTSGSSQRIRRLATFLDDIRVERANREFLTITGSYKNIPVSGLATGIGAPATIIAIVEALE